MNRALDHSISSINQDPNTSVVNLARVYFDRGYRPKDLSSSSSTSSDASMAIVGLYKGDRCEVVSPSDRVLLV